MSDRRRTVAAVAPLGLLLVLAVAVALPPTGGLGLTGDDGGSAAQWTAALDAVDDPPLVLVGFDPDVGTYAEIRPTVRTALAELLARDARLAFVSLTTEGRALLLVELERLARLGVNPVRILDLGFVAGAEAALVSLAVELGVPDAEDGAIARRLRTEGLPAVDALLVVGGNDLGPRSWVEQVLPRIEDPAVLAIVPTVLLPESQPYLASGQLDALLATPRQGAAYRSAAELGGLERFAEPSAPSSLALLIGILAAIGLIGQAWLARVVTAARGSGDRGGAR